MLELACPESCQYLRSARAQAVLRERELQEKEMAAAAAEARFLPEANIERRLMPLLYAIDGAIVGVQRESFRDLEDLDVVAGVENAIKNLETESTGLIYEHPTSSRRVQAVSDKIRSLFEDLVKDANQKDRITRSDMIAALKYVRFRAASHLRGADHSRSFMRQISLFSPWPDEATKPLII
jgi:hypothetical protein